MGSGVPPARSGWWHVKSRHALLRSRTGLRQSVVAPRLWSVRLVSSASAKRMAVEQTGIPMRPPLGASCEWGYVEWRAAGASQPSAVSAMVWMMSSLRDYGRCAWSVAHLRSAWLWGRPASPCALATLIRMGLCGVARRWRESAVCGVGDGVDDGWRVADALFSVTPFV